jgi:Flp pilus assembly secretin CpaC
MRELITMSSIYDGRKTIKKWLGVGILALASVLVAVVMPYAQGGATAADAETVLVYSPIIVTVNKSIVLRLPGKASRVSVTQPQIAEAIVVAPDQVLINGKAVGTTSLVVWFKENKSRE